jgi:hypothetical protein
MVQTSSIILTVVAKEMVSSTANYCTPPDNCYHSQWAVPCSDAANEYACQQSGGVWEGSPSPPPTPPPPPPPPPSPSGHHCAYPLNCWNSAMAYPCGMQSDALSCQASGGVWEPWSASLAGSSSSDGEASDIEEEVDVKVSSTANYVGPLNNEQNFYTSTDCSYVVAAVSVDDLHTCENVCDSYSWCNAIDLTPLGAANTCQPLSCPGTALNPSGVNGPTGPQIFAYYKAGGPSPSPPPSPSPSPSPSGHHCTPPDNCYHSQWAVPCSVAANEYACQQSGGVWEGAWGDAAFMQVV